ncbi:MAG: hypothetical protein BWY57_03076 [Betaproteobacteria bacterium ADurb.Bin341]|nr:MAG: hypothetical protein BWY57_03076 [Betaproteobacteria bacterium ADurb.Bin341]
MKKNAIFVHKAEKVRYTITLMQGRCPAEKYK